MKRPVYDPRWFKKYMSGVMFVKTVPRMLNKYLFFTGIKNPHDSIAETITLSLKITIKNISELTKSSSFLRTSEGKRHVLQAYI